MLSQFLSMLSLLSLWTTNVYSAIEVENKSGHNIRVSFHGDGCRLFDSDRFNYAPCVEKEIPINKTARFPSMENESFLTKKEQSIVPRIIFNTLGFSYSCKIQDYILNTVCRSSLITQIENQCGLRHGKRIEPPIAQNTLMLLHVASLSITENYVLQILEGYGYFPQPYVDCKITQIKAEENCPDFLPKYE